MGLEFKYGDGKVLGTQPHPTMGQLPLIVSYILISLNACSILHPKLSLSLSLSLSLTHTHTHTHSSNNQHDIKPSQNPNIHPLWQLTSSLACIYHAYHIFLFKQTRHYKGRSMAARYMA